MARILAALTVALALTTPALTSPAAAQSADGYYHAVLEKAPAPGKLVSSEVVWSGHDNMMDAPVAGDVAKRVCATLAQAVGTVTTFTAEGKGLSADELTYCNKHARKTK
eukprot:gene12969-13071_t